MGKEKAVQKPVWWKNTFFWFSGVLFILAVIGLIFGDDTIRDPGQVYENGLVWIYLGGAVVMFINGYLTHGQAVKFFAESQQDK